MMRWRDDRGQDTVGAVIVALTIVGILAFIIGLFHWVPNYKRHQALLYAQNQVKVSAIQIKNQEQRVKIARQQAQIRFESAVGVKKAQDEIQSTLTPLYVQFEMIRALEGIAKSGQNNSVIFIPTGEMGVPLVQNIGDMLRDVTK